MFREKRWKEMVNQATARSSLYYSNWQWREVEARIFWDG